MAATVLCQVDAGSSAKRWMAEATFSSQLRVHGIWNYSLVLRPYLVHSIAGQRGGLITTSRSLPLNLNMRNRSNVKPSILVAGLWVRS